MADMASIPRSPLFQGSRYVSRFEAKIPKDGGATQPSQTLPTRARDRCLKRSLRTARLTASRQHTPYTRRVTQTTINWHHGAKPTQYIFQNDASNNKGIIHHHI